MEVRLLTQPDDLNPCMPQRLYAYTRCDGKQQDNSSIHRIAEQSLNHSLFLIHH
jgi:hypothetical protein